MRFVLIFLISMVMSFQAFGQELTVQNPSFENNLPQIRVCIDENGDEDPSATEWNCPWPGNWQYRDRVAGDPGIFGMQKIEPWSKCNGVYNTPDLLPNAPDLNPSSPAAHGDWYIGLVCTNNNAPNASEGIAQPLSSPFQAGLSYTFDIKLANISNTTYMTGSYALNNPGILYLIGRMGDGSANPGCNPTSEGEEILWQSDPVIGDNWQNQSITITPTKSWSHIYLAMAPGHNQACTNDNSNILIDQIGSFFPGGLKITSPAASSNMPCSQLIEGQADEDIDQLTVTGTFDGGTADATILPSGKDWEVQVSYSNQTARTEILKVIAEYVDPTILPDTIEVPVNITGPVNDFGVSIIDVNNPVNFTDQSPTYDAGNTIVYNWDFGDGNNSSDASPAHNYATAGEYEVTQTITYNGQCSEEVKKTIVVPKEPGVVSITSPAESANLNTCAVMVTGTTNYAPDQIVVTGSPSGNVIATMLTDTTWEAEVFFSGSSSGTQTLNVEANFPANVATDSRSFDLTVSGSITTDFSHSLADPSNPYGIYSFDNATSPANLVESYEWLFNNRDTVNTEDVNWTFSNFGNQIVRLWSEPLDKNSCGDIKLDTIAIPIPALAEDGNLFLDDNGDGTMDQVKLKFEVALDSAMLSSINLTFNWYNSEDSLITITSDSLSWSIDPTDPSGQSIVWNIPDSLSLKAFSTDVKPDYGTPVVLFSVNDSLGQPAQDSVSLEIGDGMEPMVTTAIITQSPQSTTADIIRIIFSEKVDYKKVANQDLFTFKLAKNKFANDTLIGHEPIVENNWQGDGKQLLLYLKGNHKGVFPNDSVRAITQDGKVVDYSGNLALPTAPYIPIDGEIAQTEEFNSKVSIVHNEKDTAAFEDPQFFDRGTTLEDASDKQLGTYFSLVVPTQTIRGADGEDRQVPLDPEDIKWEWRLLYYDNLGNFVVQNDGVIHCTDEVFAVDGATDCTDSNVGMVFIKWNYRDQFNRKVGSGAYIQQTILNGEAFDPHTVGVVRLK